MVSCENDLNWHKYTDLCYRTQVVRRKELKLKLNQRYHFFCLQDAARVDGEEDEKEIFIDFLKVYNFQNQ